MARTFTKLLYHIVFSTKGRARMITPELEARLHPYLGGIVRGMNGVAHEINGMEDHVHLLVGWRTDETLAALLRSVKSQSSGWIHQNFPGFDAFDWQDGYGAFTVSQSQFETVRTYIQRQKEHHRQRTFDEELRAMLDAHQIPYEERHLS